MNVKDRTTGQVINGTDVLYDGNGIDLNTVDIDGDSFDITLEDKLGDATRVGLDSVYYTLSQEVQNVMLIIHLEDGNEYEYIAS